MIKFILLLPLKIIGLLFMTIGAALDNSNRRKLEREKQAARIAREQAARIEKEKRERYKLEKQAAADRRRTEKEKAAADRKKAAQAVQAQKAADRLKLEKFKVEQAETDIVHYEQQRRDLLKLYTELRKQYDAAATDSKKEISFRKILAINNQIRGVDRQIQKARYSIETAETYLACCDIEKAMNRTA